MWRKNRNRPSPGGLSRGYAHHLTRQPIGGSRLSCRRRGWSSRVNVVVIAWPEGLDADRAFERVITATEAVGHDVTTFDLVKDGLPAPHAARRAHGLPRRGTRAGAQRRRSLRSGRRRPRLRLPHDGLERPAAVRGWLERVMLPGVAFVFDADRAGSPRLGRSVRSSASRPTRRARARVRFEHDNGRRVLLRALRLNTGLRTRTRWVPCYHAPRRGSRSHETGSWRASRSR